MAPLYAKGITVKGIFSPRVKDSPPSATDAVGADAIPVAGVSWWEWTVAHLACNPRLLRSLLVFGYLVHLVLRLAISAGREGPINFADETGYLTNARVMSGGISGQMNGAAFYRGGYSLLLLPAYWLADQPHDQYRYVLATNALLSSLVFPLIHLLLTRVFRVPVQTSVMAAFLAALYPPLVVTTQFAWAESILPVLILLAALTLAAVVTAARPRAAIAWAIACGGCAGALYTTHGRTAPLVVLLVVLLLLLALVRYELIAAALAGVATTAGITLAGQALNDWLRTQSWGGHLDGDVQHVIDGARHLSSLKNVAALGAGQYWYVFVASFGLVALGLVHVGARLLSNPPSARHRSIRATAGQESGGAPVVCVFLLGSTVALIALVGLFLRPPVRPDHIVYGRYVEILVPPLLALGLVRLWTTGARRLILELAAGAVTTFVASIVVLSYADGLIRRGPVNWSTVLAIPPLAQTQEQIRPFTAALVAVAGVIGLLAVTRWSRALGAIGLASAMLLSSIAVRVVLIEAMERPVYPRHPLALPEAHGLSSPQSVSYDLATYTPISLYGYQWRLDNARFVLFDSRHDPAPQTEWVIARIDWAQAQRLGARRIWTHPESKQTLWRLPEERQLPTQAGASIPSVGKSADQP